MQETKVFIPSKEKGVFKYSSGPKKFFEHKSVVVGFGIFIFCLACTGLGFSIDALVKVHDDHQHEPQNVDGLVGVSDPSNTIELVCLTSNTLATKPIPDPQKQSAIKNYLDVFTMELDSKEISINNNDLDNFYNCIKNIRPSINKNVKDLLNDLNVIPYALSIDESKKKCPPNEACTYPFAKEFPLQAICGSYTDARLSHICKCPVGWDLKDHVCTKPTSGCNTMTKSKVSTPMEGICFEGEQVTTCPDAINKTLPSIRESQCACPAGKQRTTPSSKTCTACPTGQYSSTGAGKCTQCAAGTYLTTTGATSSSTCIQCGAGTYSTTKGATSSSTCLTCGNGRISGTGATYCGLCPNASYSNSGNTGCIWCPHGKYSSDPTKGCAQCGEGKYSDKNHGTATSEKICISCAKGTYSTKKGATSSSTCISCAAGFVPNTGKTNCIACPDWMVSFPATKPSTCVFCPNGRYKSSPISTPGNICKKCPAGQTTLEHFSFDYPSYGTIYQPNSTRPNVERNKATYTGPCAYCIPGFFAAANFTENSQEYVAPGSYGCERCPNGKYQHQAGKSKCIGCNGTIITGFASKTIWPNQDPTPPGNIGCDPDKPLCSPGYYTPDPDKFICTPCPPGKHSDGWTTCETCESEDRDKYQNKWGQQHCNTGCSGKATINGPDDDNCLGIGCYCCPPDSGYEEGKCGDDYLPSLYPAPSTNTYGTICNIEKDGTPGEYFYEKFDRDEYCSRSNANTKCVRLTGSDSDYWTCQCTDDKVYNLWMRKCI